MATIHVVYDHDGKILAASEGKHLPRPKEMHGLMIGEFEVPTNFKSKRLREYASILLVDVAQNQLKEKGKEYKEKKPE